jgi:MFS family permease
VLPGPGPLRSLSAVTLINTAGNGLWMTVNALYLTRVAGLSAGQVGLGLTVAGAVCMVASAPMGYLADRRGPRGTQVVFFAALAVLTLGMLAVRSFAALVVVASLTAIADAGQRGARGAIIAQAIPAGERVRSRAYLRAVTNVGISVGAALAGIALAVDTPLAYQLTVVGDALSFVAAAALAIRLPVVPPVPAKAGPRLVALRDRPFLALVALDGLMSMHFDILNIVLPLWIAARTDAPRWLVSVLMLVNTSMVVALQVRAARGTEDVTGAARASRGAGRLIAAACLVFLATAGPPAWVASLLLILGCLIHVIGELRHSAAGWGISFGLAPEQAQGQYQATFSMGMQLGRMLAPAVLVWLALHVGRVGWVVMAALFALVGAAIPPVVALAIRRRERAESTSLESGLVLAQRR